MRAGILITACLIGAVLTAVSVSCQPQGKSPSPTPTATLATDHSAGPGIDRCEVCGAPLFHAIPHATSRQEIIKFAKASKAFRNDKDALNGWMHPGTYCPNGCTERWETWNKVEEPVEHPSSGK